MKVQLIKTIDEMGREWYEVHKNGEYVSGSGAFNFEHAVRNFNVVVDHYQPPLPEVIMETEIKSKEI
jgi:hypothetical protein